MSMDAQALPPPKQTVRWGFLVATLLAGCVGSLIGMTAMAKGTYAMGPFVVNLSMKPSASSTTNLGIAPRITGLDPGRAVASTHSGFLKLDATVVDLVRPPRLDLAATRAVSPQILAQSLKDEGRAAQRKFGQRAAIGVTVGGAIGGAFMALFGFRPRRIFQGLLAGVILCGAMGLVMGRTYDTAKFSGVTFQPGVSALRG